MRSLVRVDEGPIRKKIQNELSALACRLSKLESSVEAYFSRDLPQYQAWLNTHFAERLGQISELEKRVCALGHHLEESLNLSVKMNVRPEDLFANWSADQIMEKILSDQEGSEEPQAEFEAPQKVTASDEAKNTYRRIARCLHPDVKGALSDAEKNLWIKAQRAYATSNTFELKRIEESLRCCNLEAEPLTCSEMLRQLSDFEKKYKELEAELKCIQSERAWNFCNKKSLHQLERELDTEYSSTVRDLKSKESHLSKTLNSWLEQKESKQVPTTKPKRRTHKSQESLF